ncbi:MAG TPA: RagB/SusD family nutrient uptake outer membrane protein, partial [Sphingobacteriaceae bacterium]
SFLGSQYFYPYKYKVQDASQNELYTLFRVSEQYLIRAESNIHLLNTVDAVNDINIIRGRAGLASLSTALSVDSCLDALLQERRVEMFAETGHRWFDLKRTKSMNEIMQKEKGNLWMASDSLYPIPASDIQRNPNLVQNLNY